MATAMAVLDPITLVLSLGYVVAAQFTGARLSWDRQRRMMMCTRASRRLHGRAGMTIGCVYVTSDVEVAPAVRDHESHHRDQWAVGGLLFPVLYGLESWRTRKDITKNVFERAAGLEDGGYVPPVPDPEPSGPQA